MVFEALVVDVLNRFIGDYVENLDSSQLKIGIWGGKNVITKKTQNFISVCCNVYKQYVFYVLLRTIYTLEGDAPARLLK